jgi:hypothetical protein
MDFAASYGFVISAVGLEEEDIAAILPAESERPDSAGD